MGVHPCDYARDITFLWTSESLWYYNTGTCMYIAPLQECGVCVCVCVRVCVHLYLFPCNVYVVLYAVFILSCILLGTCNGDDEEVDIRQPMVAKLSG